MPLLNVALILTLFITGCGSKPTPAPEPTPAPPTQSPAPTPVSSPVTPSRLIVGHTAEISRLDPPSPRQRNYDERMVCQTVFEGLVRYGEGRNDVEPALAERWDVTSDGLTWTFYLRKGVTFHDGTFFTAQSVKYNFDRWLADFRDDLQADLDFIRAVEARDDYTVELSLARPYSALLQRLASLPFVFASPSAIQQSGDKFGTADGLPAGTGPFMVDAWTGDRIQLVRNPAYWGNAPALAGLEFLRISDPQAQLLALQNGEIDTAFGLPAAQAEDIEDIEDIEEDNRPDNQLRGFTSPGGFEIFLGLNQAHTPLADSKVRQAIAHALDRPAAVRAAFGSDRWAADGLLSPAFHQYDEYAAADEHDPELGRQLLSEAGYASAEPITLLYPDHMDDVPDPRGLAEAIRDDLREIGLAVEVQEVERNEYWRRVYQGETQLYLAYAGSARGDAYEAFCVPFCGQWPLLASGAPNSELLARLDEAAQAVDPEENARLYRAAEKIMHDQALLLPLAYLPVAAVTRSEVQGFGLHPFRTSFETVTLLPSLSADLPLRIAGPDVAAVGEPVALTLEAVGGAEEVCTDDTCPAEGIRLQEIVTDGGVPVYVDLERRVLIPQDEGTIKVSARYEFEGKEGVTPPHEIEAVWIPAETISLGARDEGWPPIPVSVAGGAPILFDVLGELTARGIDLTSAQLKYTWDFGDGIRATAFGDGTRRVTREREGVYDEACPDEPPWYDECQPLPPYGVMHAFAADGGDYQVSVTVEEQTVAGPQLVANRLRPAAPLTDGSFMTRVDVRSRSVQQWLEKLSGKLVDKGVGKKLNENERARLKKLVNDALTALLRGDKRGATAAAEEILKLAVLAAVSEKALLVGVATQVLSAIIHELKGDPVVYDVFATTPENGVIDDSIQKNTHFWVNDKDLEIKSIASGVTIGIGYNFGTIWVKGNNGILDITTNAGDVKIGPRNDEDIKIMHNRGTITITIDKDENNDLIKVTENEGTIVLQRHDNDLIVDRNLPTGIITLTNYDEVRIDWNVGGLIHVLYNEDNIVVEHNGEGAPCRSSTNCTSWGRIVIDSNNDFIDVNDNGRSGNGGQCFTGPGGLVEVNGNNDEIEVAPGKIGRVDQHGGKPVECD